MTNKTLTLTTLALSLSVLACDRNANTPKNSGGHTDEPPPTNRIDVPAAVRKNLGISFVKVERRAVKVTLRIPGRFELKPSARREYHATLAGHVSVDVEQYAPVKAGRVLARVNAPAWHDMRQGLAQEIQSIREASVKLAATEKHLAAAQQHLAKVRVNERIWNERLVDLKKLAQAGGGGAGEFTATQAQIAATHTAEAEVLEEIAILEKEKATLAIQLEGAQRRNAILYAAATAPEKPPVAAAADLALTRASAASGYSVLELVTPAEIGGRSVPGWQALDILAVRATQPGLVERLAITPGAWVETGGLILSTVDLSQVRFRAVATQSDLGRLRDGLPATIAPPQDGPTGLQDTVAATMRLGTEADPHQRTFEVVAAPTGALPPWARPGVSAHLEIVTNPDIEPTLAVPASAVVKDGLKQVLFRRDPRDPNKVIRIEADTGTSDGRWVEVLSGITDGDEVVLHGAYELMLAGSGQAKGGHFHSDGTFHQGED